MIYVAVILSAISVLATLAVVWLFLRDRNRARIADYRAKTLTETLPNRLQAYERLALYLSRISPEEMAVREQMTAASAKDLYIAMSNAIRQEFEHNVVMQIYISAASWKRVLKAKEMVLNDLKEAFKSTHPNAKPIEYAAEFIELAKNSCNFYVERAQEGLRKDIAGEVFDD